MEQVLRGNRNGPAIYALTTTIVDESSVIVATVPLAQAGIELLKASAERFKQWAGNNASDPHTERLHELDDQRNDHFVWFRDFVKSQCHSPSALVAAHATSLWSVFERHGLALFTEGYTTKSAKLQLLLAELSTRTRDIAGTTTEPWLERLSASASAFDLCTNERNSNAKVTDGMKAVAAITDMAKYLNLLLNSFSLLEESTTDAAIKASLLTINTTVAHYNATVRAGRTRTANTAKDAKDSKDK